jgi:4-aminobutyrate aminotransferase-like enzyme
MGIANNINSPDIAQFEEYAKNVMVGGGTPGPCLIEGKGVRVKDDTGKSYIDCTSQSWALYLGYCNEEIRQTVYEHMKKLTHVHQGFSTKQRYLLAGKLASLAPKNLNRVSFTVGGGSAIEAAMKIALKNVPNSTQFITLWDAYHGSTLTTAGASWTSTRASGDYTGVANFSNGVNKNFVRVPNPYCYRCYFDQKPGECNYMCAEMLRHTLENGVNGPAAGVIIEPIQASGGQIICPKGYLERVREICNQFGTLLIFDEIQTYCRIGEFFAAEYFGVEPDIIVLGKGLGGGFPIAAIIIHDRLKGFEMNGEELHTFANNSVSQVAALKMIDIIEKDDLLQNTRDVGEYLASKLKELQEKYPQMGDIRQVGMHIGIEMIEDPKTKEPLSKEKALQIRSVAMNKGLILGTGGFRKNILKVKPPLIVNRIEADEIVSLLEETFISVLN